MVRWGPYSSPFTKMSPAWFERLLYGLTLRISRLTCYSVAFLPGTTTFRLKSHGITMFLDAWLERPKTLPIYLSLEDVTEADYIFISHAHFDQCVALLFDNL